MDINEVLQFVDEMVYAKTGKRLNDLQRGVIEGILKQQKYPEIADTCHRSKGHVKDVGYELLQILSNVFDEPVDKKNLKSVLERQGNLNVLGNTFGNSNIIGYINVCSDRPTATPSESQCATPETNQAKIETVSKLRQFGLSDEKIAAALGLSLEEIKQIDL